MIKKVRAIKKRQKSVYAFIDASNLFYGGEKSLGWSIDYKKLFGYLKDKYKARKIFYYGGIEIYDYNYSVLDKNSINLNSIIKHLQNKLRNKRLNEAEIVLLASTSKE